MTHEHRVSAAERLVADHKAQPHHILPESGWVSYVIKDPSDVAAVIVLSRLNFDRPWTGSGEGPVDVSRGESAPRGHLGR